MVKAKCHHRYCYHHYHQRHHHLFMKKLLAKHRYCVTRFGASSVLGCIARWIAPDVSKVRVCFILTVEEEQRKFLRNGGKHWPNDAVFASRNPWTLSTPLSEPRTVGHYVLSVRQNVTGSCGQTELKCLAPKTLLGMPRGLSAHQLSLALLRWFIS